MKHCALRFLIITIIFAINASFLQADPSVFSYDGHTLNLTTENGSIGQVLDLLNKKTGLEFDVPGEFKTLRLPLVEIRGLTVKAALLKVLEGSNYDYILVSGPGDPEKVLRLLVTGKSTRIAASAVASAAPNRQMNRQIMEDPFGGGGDYNADDVSNVQSEPPVINAAPAQNVPPQGAGANILGVQPATSAPNPYQPVQPGVAPQLPQGQPQGFPPFTPLNDPNKGKSPY